MPLQHRLLLVAAPLLFVAACSTAPSEAEAPAYHAPEVMTGSRVPHGASSQPSQTASGESVRNAGGIASNPLPRQPGMDR